MALLLRLFWLVRRHIGQGATQLIEPPSEQEIENRVEIRSASPAAAQRSP
jgi:hypothetical protein